MWLTNDAVILYGLVPFTRWPLLLCRLELTDCLLLSLLCLWLFVVCWTLGECGRGDGWARDEPRVGECGWGDGWARDEPRVGSGGLLLPCAMRAFLTHGPSKLSVVASTERF